METAKAIEIKVVLLRLGISQAQVARDLHMKRSSVNQVINGRARSRRVEQYLEALAKKVA